MQMTQRERERRKAKNGEHGFWSTNPGTGWWIVGGIGGAAFIVGGVFGIRYLIKRPPSDLQGPKSAADECQNYRGHVYCLYQDKSPQHSEWYYFAVDSGAVSKDAAKKEDAHTRAKAAIDLIPPISPIEEDEPLAGVEPPQPGQVGVIDTAITRHGIRVRPSSRSIEVVNRAQWQQYAPPAIAALNPAAWDSATLLDRLWSQTFPDEVPTRISQTDGWTVAGQPYADVVATAQRFQDRVNQGVAVIPRNATPEDYYAVAALGEIPAEYSVSGLDLGASPPGELWERQHPSGDVYPIVLRYREEKIPGQTRRYWQWLVWKAGTIQLRVQNARETGGAPNKNEARAEAFAWVDGLAQAQASTG